MFMNLYKLIIGTLLLFSGVVSFGQNPQQLNKGVRIMFYNVENLFHPSNDSLKMTTNLRKKGCGIGRLTVTMTS